jgi:hypothetical protein
MLACGLEDCLNVDHGMSEPAVRGLRPRSGIACLRNARLWTSIEVPGQLDQPLAEALIPEFCAAELLFGPIGRRFHPRLRDMGGLLAQHGPPALAERQRIDVLDGLAACHLTILTPSPLRRAQVLPVRRLIARTSKALLVDKGLQEYRLVSVPLEPILAKSTNA